MQQLVLQNTDLDVSIGHEGVYEIMWVKMSHL